MQMPGRHGSLSGANYRYKFNGMEADSEVTGEGNSYTTQFRQYDPRLGRWKSLDPLASQFPWQSPFNGMDNNPISLIDPLGLSTQEGGDGKAKKTKNGWFRDKDGKATTDKDGNAADIEGATVEVTTKVSFFKKIRYAIKRGVRKIKNRKKSRNDNAQIENNYYGSSSNGETSRWYKEMGAMILGGTNAIQSNLILGIGRQDPYSEGSFGNDFGLQDKAAQGQMIGDGITIIGGILLTVGGGAATVAIPQLAPLEVALADHMVLAVSTAAINFELTRRKRLDNMNGRKRGGSSEKKSNYKKIKEKDGNKYAKKAGFESAHDFKDAWRPSGKNKDWDITIDSKTNRLGLRHKDGTEIETDAYIQP